MDEPISSYLQEILGVPDRIVVLPGGKIGFAEIKRPGEEPRKLQEKQIMFLQKLGFIVKVIDSVEGVENFMQEVMSK